MHSKITEEQTITLNH